MLKKYYWMIREVYKYQSAIGTSVGSTPFAIPLNFYTDYVKNAGILDGKELTISESDTVFLTINKRSKVTPLIPGNALVRFQFLEICMRLGLKRNTGIKDQEKRLFVCLERNIVGSSKIEKAQEWRWRKYWNEAVDNLYKFHMKLLQEVYNNYSGGLKKPGEENYMAASEFQKIWEDSNLQNERFANRDINVCFNLAMQTRVDEINSDKHLKMSFIEFLEALARAANYLSYPPPSQAVRDAYKNTGTKKPSELEEVKGEPEDEEEMEMTLDEMIDQPLNKKIENILPYLLVH